MQKVGIKSSLATTTSSFLESEKAGNSSQTQNSKEETLPANVVCEGDVCKIVPNKNDNAENNSNNDLEVVDSSIDNKMAKAKELIEKKRKEKENEEKEVHSIYIFFLL